MELLLEILFIGTLISGLLYFIFDIQKILLYIAAFICWCAAYILAGFFIGIGIHWTNLTFGW